MHISPNQPGGAEPWRQPLGYDDKQYFSVAGISIEEELVEFCSSAIPLQWFAESEVEKQRCAVSIARSLAARKLAEDAALRQPAGKFDAASEVLKTRYDEFLQLWTLILYAPLLALILSRTARCATDPQVTWNSPLAAGLYFGRLLDLIRPVGESGKEIYDPLFVYFASAVEMGSLPLQNDEEPKERPCFRNAILLWAKYAEFILQTLTSRGLRINRATVRECTTAKQAVGSLKLGAHPVSVVTALCDSDNGEVDFLGPFTRACVAFHVSPSDVYQQGSDAAADSTMPALAWRYDDLLDNPEAKEDSPPTPAPTGPTHPTTRKLCQAESPRESAPSPE